MADDALEGTVRAAVEEAGVPYEVMPCDPDFADTAAFCERYRVAPGQSANTIVVASKRGEKRYVACVVLATTRLDVNGTVRRLMGVNKASFASADETRELTGMLVGGVTAVALPDGMPIYVDSRVMDLPEVVIGGGSRSMKLLVSPELFLRLPNATVIDGLAVPAPTG